MELTVGVNNVLDTDPPPCFSCQAGGFDPAQYDVPGQFGYVRLVWRP
jgi:iron complex outermembrane receptor protein